MARILTPNKGIVQVFGTMSSLLELGTGFHHELTGRENVYLAGSLLGQSKQQVDKRYDEIVDFADIERFMDMPVKNYSSGMYARLAFAVAISVEPEILLVDEVLSVGDENFQMKCYERIAEFRKQGRTIVLVSHSLDSIRSLCSEAVWIEDGVIRQTGEANDVVAGYLSQVHTEAARQHGGSHEGDRWGSGIVRITDVTLEGPAGATGAFRTGEPMKIRISYDAQEAVDDVSCGVAIYRGETLAHVFGQNTHEAGIDLRLSGSGTIEFDVAELPLLKGNYVLTVALHDHAVKHIYDWLERRYSFMVFENPEDAYQAGLVRVDGTWRTSSSPVAAA